MAIKVLPAHASSDADARARFEREAKAIAALDHPHICAVYDIGRDAGVDFIVMQYLEGETLASRLQQGALPLDQVLRYVIQIAGALDKAHRQGVVRRDLKPANIMLSKTGERLLDFGLARLQPAATAVAGLSAVATEAPSLTAAGTILGTLQYTAPEQLEGGEADARTDIFAFGSVIYEMTTGKKAFNGKSQASEISAIMARRRRRLLRCSRWRRHRSIASSVGAWLRMRTIEGSRRQISRLRLRAWTQRRRLAEIGRRLESVFASP